MNILQECFKQVQNAFCGLPGIDSLTQNPDEVYFKRVQNDFWGPPGIDSLTKIPDDLKDIILWKSDFPDILALSITNKEWAWLVKDRSILWKKFGQKIGLNPSLRTNGNMQSFCKTLYNNTATVADKISINLLSLSAPAGRSFNEAGSLKMYRYSQYRIAKNVIKIWKRLEHRITRWDHEYRDFYKDPYISTFSSVLEKAGEFEGWCKRNQESLSKSTNIDLSTYSLAPLPPEIGKLTYLSDLDLSKNSLSFLPCGFEKLTNLRSLNLSQNALTWFPEIGKLTNLRSLNLSNNSLTSFPLEIGKLTNLVILSLNKNSITSLSDEIGKLTNLTLLNLSKNSLTSFPLEIGKLTDLEYLNLTNNSITSLPVEFTMIAKLLGPNLKIDENLVSLVNKI